MKHYLLITEHKVKSRNKVDTVFLNLKVIGNNSTLYYRVILILTLYCYTKYYFLRSELIVMVPIIVDYILGVGKTHSPRIATPHKYFDLEE